MPSGPHRSRNLGFDEKSAGNELTVVVHGAVPRRSTGVSMSDINLESLITGGVTIRPRLEEKHLVVALDGVCDSFAVKPSAASSRTSCWRSNGWIFRPSPST